MNILLQNFIVVINSSLQAALPCHPHSHSDINTQDLQPAVHKPVAAAK